MFTRWLVLSLLTANLVAEARQPASRLGRVLEGAYQQIGKTTIYDGTYRRISFPGGNVPRRGVCTDVIVRAYRHAGLDLQVLVNQDMTRSFHAYPQLWGLSEPIPISTIAGAQPGGILQGHGTTLAVSTRAGDYAAGDIVTWLLASGVPHIGFVADRSGKVKGLSSFTISGRERKRRTCCSPLDYRPLSI